MEVVAVSPRGYCFGVVNALSIVKQAIKEHPDKQIYILGIIIHNKFVKEALDKLGVISLYDPSKTKVELLESVKNGVIIFSAHGISEQLINQAHKQGLIVYNAVCKDVTKTQDIVKDYLNKNYDVLYIGKKDHPEADAMLSISPKIKLVSKLSDLEDLDINNHTIVTNQTTMSIYDTKELVDKIIEINNKVEVIHEICRATQMRQEALFDLQDFDLIYVVGDKLSNNSNNLAKVARRSVDTVRFIESVQDIVFSELETIQKVGVTSGASTPTSITQQVIDCLLKYPKIDQDDLIIDYSKII